MRLSMNSVKIKKNEEFLFGQHPLVENQPTDIEIKLLKYICFIYVKTYLLLALI